MSIAGAYLFFSMCLGLAQAVDAYVLQRRGLAVMQSRWLLVFAGLEYAWAALSAWLWWRPTDADLPLWLPQLFVAYFVTSLLAGLWHAWQQREQLLYEADDSEPDLVPQEFIWLSGGFGLVFAALAAQAWWAWLGAAA